MASPSSDPSPLAEVSIRSGPVSLSGILSQPDEAQAVVLFAHGSGSGRLSPRNQAVARALQEGGLATLLVDLLTDDESSDRARVFDIDLLAARLLSCTDWLIDRWEARLPIGYFGASTGAAAALVAAAQRASEVKAIVSRGGRPDLAANYLSRVHAPTLLIVGGNDEPVISLNQEVLTHLNVPNELVMIRGATHLFEEPGALEQVSSLALDWFLRYLTR